MPVAAPESALHQLSVLLARLFDLVETLAGHSNALVPVRLHAPRHDVLLLSKKGL